MSNARAVLGAGLVSLDLWDPDAQLWSGFEAPVDADKFEIKPNFEEKVSVSKSHLDYGQARVFVVLPSPTEITIEIAAANAKAFAMQFQGAVAAMNQAAMTTKPGLRNSEGCTEAKPNEIQRTAPLPKSVPSTGNSISASIETAKPSTPSRRTCAGA